MKKILLILFILTFLIKTGNVLSNDSIFRVDNVQVDGKMFKNDSKLIIDSAFRKGFELLSKKILLKKDYVKILSLETKDIRGLVSHYQIRPLDDEKKNIKTFNIIFDKQEIYELFYKNKIVYSDLTNVEVLVFPLLISKNDFFAYNDNYFYKNWGKVQNSKDLESSQIEYILPLEDIEKIQIIKNQLEEIENINIKNFFQGYDIENFSFLIFNIDDNDVKIFINNLFSEKKIIKNLTIKNINLDNKELYFDNIIANVKKEIFELLKAQNTIDVRTPSFLNLNLNIKNSKNLRDVIEKIEEIDLIENYLIHELNSRKVKIKIKHYGKIRKLTKIMEKKGLKIRIENNEWKISL